MPVIGAEKPIRDLEEYIRVLERRGDEIPYEIKTSVVREIVRTRSIDTTAMIQAVDYHQEIVTSGHQTFRIDTSNDESVTYDGFVEVDGVTRNWQGRWNFRGGIENANIHRIFDEFAREAFVV